MTFSEWFGQLDTQGHPHLREFQIWWASHGAATRRLPEPRGVPDLYRHVVDGGRNSNRELVKRMSARVRSVWALYHLYLEDSNDSET